MGGGGRGGTWRRSAAGGGAPAASDADTPKLYAFDKATGKQVGAVNIPTVNSAVPMTFLHQGKQYIVFATGAGDRTALVALTLTARGAALKTRCQVPGPGAGCQKIRI